MIIDAHVHLGESEKSKRYFTFDAYLSLMANIGIDKAVVMPSVSNIISIYDSNKSLMDGFNKLRSKVPFLPFLLIDPNDKKVLSQYTKDVVGLKLHPSITRVKACDKILWKYYEFAREHKLPVIIHCGRNWISNISFVIEIAEVFPEVSFIAAHLGGNASDLIEDAFVQLMKTPLSNIFLDTSNGKSPWLIEEAIKVVGCSRVIFGSDEPFADVRIGKMCVELANLTEVEKELIFSRNILRLLKK